MTETTLVEESLHRAAGAVAGLIQGEVLAVPDACVVIADASAPLSDDTVREAREAGVADGLIVVPQPGVDAVALLTQTCDLQETTDKEHTCLVAPIVKVSPVEARAALRGQGMSFAALPWVDDVSVADLSRITTVERSVLVDVVSLGRPGTPEERLNFSERVIRYLTRPALPDPINVALRPLVSTIKRRHGKDSAEGRCANRVQELRLEATPSLDDPEPALEVLVVLEEAELPTVSVGRVRQGAVDALIEQGSASAATAVEAADGPVSKREAWTALAECWIDEARRGAVDVEGVDAVQITVLNGEELSYARSLSAPILDLIYLSTKVA